MAYTLELDDLPRELRKDVAGTLRFFPKVNGINVAAHATATNHSFTVHKPDGTQIEAISSVSPTTVSTYSRLDLPVSAISELDEGYQVRLSWQDLSGSAYFEVLAFDVVLWPFDQPLVSLNDLIDERPEILEVLQRLGIRRGLSSGIEAEEYAAVIAARAHLELYTLIRNQILSDRNEEGTYVSAPRTGHRRTRAARPNLILNRQALRRVELQLALAKAYEADMGSPDSEEDSSALLHAHYRAAADRAWGSVGPLQYDSVEDLTPDEEITHLSRTVRLRRVQA